MCVGGGLGYNYVCVGEIGVLYTGTGRWPVRARLIKQSKIVTTDKYVQCTNCVCVINYIHVTYQLASLQRMRMLADYNNRIDTRKAKNNYD